MWWIYGVSAVLAFAIMVPHTVKRNRIAQTGLDPDAVFALLFFTLCPIINSLFVLQAAWDLINDKPYNG